MEEKILKVCAENIKRLRKERGWSQELLAAQAGLHRTYISGIERAERNISLANLERIADALGVDPSSLLSKSNVSEDKKRRS